MKFLNKHKTMPGAVLLALTTTSTGCSSIKSQAEGYVCMRGMYLQEKLYAHFNINKNFDKFEELFVSMDVFRDM